MCFQYKDLITITITLYDLSYYEPQLLLQYITNYTFVHTYNDLKSKIKVKLI